MSYQTAAVRLGCPVGTVSVRLMRARDKLRARLLRRGEVFHSDAAVDLSALNQDRQPVAPMLVAAVADRATALIAGRMAGSGPLPASITNLVREVTMTMFARQFAARAAGALIVGALLAGSGAIGYQATGKGAHPGTIVTQPPSGGSGPVKADDEDQSQTETNRAKSINNLRQIGVALNTFDQANGFLPPPAIRDPNTGKPLLSWRVAILPWIGSRDCTSSFISMRPGTARTTRPCWRRCRPYMLQSVGKTEEPFATFYQVFVGPGTPFEVLPINNLHKLGLTSISDGAANTLAVVEAGSAVPWTKPDDIPFQPDQPLPPLGGLFKEGFNVVFLDASVISVARRC